MAKRNFFLDMSKQVTNDFDPTTVYEGISDIDGELEELEEIIPEENDEEYSNLDEEIEALLESNKKLIMKLRSVADVVAQGIQKAANLKSLKLVSSHLVEPADEEFKNELSLITDQNKITDLLNERRAIEGEISTFEDLLKLLKQNKDDQNEAKDKIYSKSNIKDKEKEIKEEIKAAHKLKAEKDAELNEVERQHDEMK